MSRQIDSNLTKVLRERGTKLLQYTKQIEQWVELYPIEILFYISLLTKGCKPIGRIDDEVVLMCGNKIVRILMYETLGYPEKFEEFKGIIGEITRLRILTAEERKKLFDDWIDADVTLTEIPPNDNVLEFLVFWNNNYLYLSNLYHISLYLDKINIDWGMYSSEQSIRFRILLSRPPNERDFISIVYEYHIEKGEESGEVRFSGYWADDAARSFLLEEVPHEKGDEKKVIEESINMIIKALNEKYYAVDDLLRDVEEVLKINTKGLVLMLLY